MADYDLQYFDAWYDVNFKTPFFDVCATSPEILETFFRELYTFVTVNPADMKYGSGASVADHFVQVSLFRGSGEARLTSQGFQLALRNAVPRDRELVLATITCCLRALAAHVPPTFWQNEVLRSNLTIALDSPKERDEFMAAMAAAMPRTKSRDAKRIVTPVFKTEYQIQYSPEEVAACAMEITRRWGMPTELFVSLHGNFSSTAYDREVGEKDTIEDRIRHRVSFLAEVAEDVFSSINLKPKTKPS